VTIFTKFDAQIIQEYTNLNGILDDKVKWEKARENAESTFQSTYLLQLLSSAYPPKAYVQLEGEYVETLLFIIAYTALFNRYGYARE
jgi:hypothetical protein